MVSGRTGFTLIELLVVIAVLALLAGLLFPVFSRAKEAAKKSTCLSNESQIGEATIMYLSDYDGTYAETKDPDPHPALDDADGSLNEPDYGSTFDLLQPYLANSTSKLQLLACPSGADPFGATCLQINPDVPSLTSYIVNGYFVFGLKESGVGAPSNTIVYDERRSESGGGSPFCDYVYYPWFNPSNASAPEDDMDPVDGAVATTRHYGHSNFGFADGHVKSFAWSQTYAPPKVDLHMP